MIGAANQNISSNFSGSIDLFAWGTSGYSNCMPYEMSLSFVYGGGLSSIAGTQYDWGVKNFTNYRTLTNSEWSYLLSSRSNATSLRGPAKVGTVCGWILLPGAVKFVRSGRIYIQRGGKVYDLNGCQVDAMFLNNVK